MLLDGEVVAVMDYKLGQEYRDVALRPEHLSAANLSAAKVLTLIETLEDRAEFVEVGVRQRPLSQDPNDDMILDLAIHGKVDAIVTNNVKHMRVPASRFGLATLTPAEWLEKQRKEKYVH